MTRPETLATWSMRLSKEIQEASPTQYDALADKFAQHYCNDINAKYALHHLLHFRDDDAQGHVVYFDMKDVEVLCLCKFREKMFRAIEQIGITTKPASVRECKARRVQRSTEKFVAAMKYEIECEQRHTCDAEAMMNMMQEMLAKKEAEIAELKKGKGVSGKEEVTLKKDAQRLSKELAESKAETKKLKAELEASKKEAKALHKKVKNMQDSVRELMETKALLSHSKGMVSELLQTAKHAKDILEALGEQNVGKESEEMAGCQDQARKQSQHQLAKDMHEIGRELDNILQECRVMQEAMQMMGREVETVVMQRDKLSTLLRGSFEKIKELQDQDKQKSKTCTYQDRGREEDGILERLQQQCHTARVYARRLTAIFCARSCLRANLLRGCQRSCLWIF